MMENMNCVEVWKGWLRKIRWCLRGNVILKRLGGSCRGRRWEGIYKSGPMIFIIKFALSIHIFANIKIFYPKRCLFFHVFGLFQTKSLHPECWSNQLHQGRTDFILRKLLLKIIVDTTTWDLRVVLSDGY